MYPTELIGKRVVRAKPCKVETDYLDYSFTTDPIIILDVTDSHIIYSHCFLKVVGLLDNRWIDDGWINYDNLFSNIIKLFTF